MLTLQIRNLGNMRVMSCLGRGLCSLSALKRFLLLLQVASRRMIIYTSVMLLTLSVVNKFGALFTTIPDPVIGGAFLVLFGESSDKLAVLYNLLSLRKKATIQKLTTMLTTSKNVLFPGPNHLLTTGADDPTL